MSAEDDNRTDCEERAAIEREWTETTGGYAFPRSPGRSDPGMTLRDWFAGKAFAGMMSDPDCDNSPPVMAVVAYDYAEAMIAERLKRRT